jgi:hypothetical protein
MSKELKEKAIDIKGKDYVLIKDRVIYFNETYQNTRIETSVKTTDRGVLARAKVTPDVENGERYYTGHAESKNGAKGPEGESMVEVAETSAVGRALAMMGIGVIDSIASADEMRNVGNKDSPKATEKQINLILKLAKEKGIDLRSEQKEKIASEYTINQASKQIEKLMNMSDADVPDKEKVEDAGGEIPF